MTATTTDTISVPLAKRYVGEYPVDITTLGLPGMPVRSEQKERR
jgi:hypothetical protein